MKLLFQGICLFFSLCSPFLGQCKEKTFCFFTPPSDWRAADPKMLSPLVQVGFFGKGTTTFHPSLNLAIEEVGDTSLKDYLKAVKEIHESDRNTSWRDLGKFQTKAGTAELTEIATKTNWGEVKMLQVILIEDGTAYIVTGAMVKDEFATFRGPIVKAFRSLTITPDLVEAIPVAEKKMQMQKAYQKLILVKEENKQEERKKIRKEAFETFQDTVLKDGKEMGMHWQILLLKEAYDSMNLLPVSQEVPQ